jgi:hypothetical protein
MENLLNFGGIRMKVYIVTKTGYNDQDYEDSYYNFKEFIGAYGSLEQARDAIMEMTTKENFYETNRYERTIEELVENDAQDYYSDVVRVIYDSYEYFGIMTDTYDIIICEI